MPYDSIITRSDADALIPVEQATEVLKALAGTSAVLQLCRTTTMSAKVKQQPVLSALPLAYWVSGDTGLKQTTEAAWTGVDLVAEEIAVLVPCPEAALNDSSFDVWAELREPIAEAFAVKLDRGDPRRRREAHSVPARLWRAKIRTQGSSDVYVVDSKLAAKTATTPGGTTGWHGHPGPA